MPLTKRRRISLLTLTRISEEVRSLGSSVEGHIRRHAIREDYAEVTSANGRDCHRLPGGETPQLSLYLITIKWGASAGDPSSLAVHFTIHGVH